MSLLRSYHVTAAQSTPLFAMAFARVRVTQATTGEEMLPATSLPCLDLATHAGAALGSRPSRPVTFFKDGVLVAEQLETAPAVATEALTEEDRASFESSTILILQVSMVTQLRSLMSLRASLRLQRTTGRSFLQLSVTMDLVCGWQASNAGATRRVLAAMRRGFGGSNLQYAGEALKSDKEVVLAAARKRGTQVS